MNNTINTLKKSVIAAILVAGVALSFTPAQAHAAAADYQKAQISFTFDDGFESMYQNAVPILQAAGYKGTLYYISGLGDGTVGNGMTDDGKPGMTWDQAVNLQNEYGWEIGGHTQNHTPLTTVTSAQVDAELSQSNAELVAHGINPVRSFAFPEGDYNNATLVETAKYYQDARGFQDVGLDTYPYSNTVIYDESLDSFTTLAQAEAFVDQAIANKQYLVFTGHGIQAKADKNYAYIWTTADFQALVSYVKSKNVPVVKIGDATAPIGTNLTSNGSFEQSTAASGVNNGFTTDNATDVTVDTNTNGSYPSPTNSVKMTGSATGSHLFSTLINVTAGKDYLVNAFVNTIGLTSGEFGFYLDQYDANNNWVAGQWLGLVANNTVGLFNKIVQAASTLVTQFRVQAYLTPNSTGSVYTDNVNLYDMAATGSATVTPTPTGTVTPTPTPVENNIMTNGSFESGLTGWTNDNAANVVADPNNGLNSVKLTGNTTAAHLFQNIATFDNTATYTFTANANANALTAGELGFYIDEYNAQGTWISGQWLGAIVNGATTTFTKAYKATSTLVNNIRVQTYLVANSVGSAFVDDYSLSNNTVTATPTPTGTVTPTPSDAPTGTVTPTPTGTVTPIPTITPTPATNIIANPSFETVTNGFADSWTHDTTDFVIDTTSNGNNGTNSLHIGPNTNYAHAFSAMTAIDATKSYTWSQYVSTLTGTGEFGFYIDEYDSAGTWLSGQWKGMIAGPFTGQATFSYVPTSTAVKQVRLQYYTTANSTFNLYIDSVSLSN